MGKKPAAPPAPPPVSEWDPNSKEPWHVDFEKEEVNDDKWTCIVSAAIQAEAQDEESIQIFSQCAATGLRRAIKTISMNDVVNLLKQSVSVAHSKNERKIGKEEKIGRKEKSGKFLSEGRITDTRIVELAAKYAVFNEVECILPTDLMAAVLKHIILGMKRENILQKRTNATMKRKYQEEEIRKKFIRDLKPYEATKEAVEEEEDEEEDTQVTKRESNILGIRDSIDDEPFAGPDLYILLTDFYNPFIFPDLLRINVLFVALIKIKNFPETGKWSHTSVPGKVETVAKKGALVAEFWQTLKENCVALDKTTKFKDILMMLYQAPLIKSSELKQYNYDVLFDELSWMQYSAHFIYRQHQNYLQEIFVQRNVMSLEPLNLADCELYNKLCDVLVTGEPNTPSLVLYAMIEQVVVGVPNSESVPLEFEPKFCDYFTGEDSETSSESSSKNFQTKIYNAVTPCTQCRKHLWVDVCGKWEKFFLEDLVEKGEWYVRN